MKYAKRVEIFRQAKADYAGFLTSILWKLTGDKELFTEAMQYALLGMWRHVEKLNGKKAGAYIYRIARDGEFDSVAKQNRQGRPNQQKPGQYREKPARVRGNSELVGEVRRAISQLPAKQGRAIVMRYFEQKEYQAISEKLGCSEAGARSNVSKAVATLKGKLAALLE